MIMNTVRGVVAWTMLLGLAVAPARAEAPSYRAISGVTYAKRDERLLKADVFTPTKEGKHPGVLIVHGGAWRGGNRHHLGKAADALAKAGYVTVSIDYRLAPKDPFPAQIEDCKDAVRWMRTNAEKYHIDADRVGGFGYSAGGHLVALLGTAEETQQAAKPGVMSTRLQAVVAGGAPVDFQLLPRDATVLSYWLGGTRAEKPDLYRQASPLEFVTPDDPPMLLFHGTRDAIVPSLNAIAMAAKLQAAKVPVETLLVERKGHIAAMFDQQAIERAVKFFDKHLKSVEQKPQ
jgi:acetyl esterase/lipase